MSSRVNFRAQEIHPCSFMEEEEAQDDDLAKDVAPALLALHPHNEYIVVAVGTKLRIFNFSEKCPVVTKDATHPSCHGDAIKAIGFDREGKLFVSAGDDKLVKLWDTESWQCIKTVHANKKVSAATFSHDSQWLLFADKFGVIYIYSTRSNENHASSVLDQPVQLLAHCCSIVTSMECSPDGRYIVTTDRDFKIRVSVFPKNPLKGAHEIQGFCLGHTSFVSCVAFVGEDGETRCLVSGGGDGTVRLWDPETIELLDTFHAGLITGNDGKEPVSSSILGISVSNKSSIIAVVVESLDGIIFLRCDFNSSQLLFLQKVRLAEHFCPTSAQFDRNGLLWMVAGAAEMAEAQIAAAKAVTWVKVVSTSSLSNSGNELELEILEDESIPGGNLLLRTIEGDQLDSEKALSLADAANLALRNHLSKRQYTQEHREYRKRMRNDRKLQSKA